MSALLIAVVGGLVGGVVSPVLLDAYREHQRNKKWAAPRKALLKQLLERKDFRTLETLCRVSGTTEEECKTLLITLGARGALLKSGKEGWTLKPIGAIKPDEFDDE